MSREEGVVVAKLSHQEDEKPLELKSLEQAVSYCGFRDKKELNDFWASDSLWRLWASEIEDNVINPEKSKAKISGKTGLRLMNLKTAEALLLEGEKEGRSRFRRETSDKTGWAYCDYYAFALYHIQRENTDSHDGLFFDIEITLHAKLRVIWTLLRLHFYQSTESISKIREDRAAAKAPKAVKRYSNQELSNDNKRKKTSHKPPVDAEKLHQSGRPFNKPGEAPRSNIEEFAEDAEIPNEDDELCGLFGTSKDQLDNTSIDEVVNQLKKIGALPETITAVIDPQVEVLSPHLRMQLERKGNSIRDRAHKHDLIIMLRKGFVNPRFVDAKLYEVAAKERNIDNHLWRLQVAHEAEEAALPIEVNLDDDEERDKYNESIKLLEITECQPQGRVAACDRMGLNRPDHPRYDSMPLTYSFKFFQVVAFDRMHALRAAGMNGVLLCDYMGLGKTWIAVGYMLSYLHQREKDIKEGNPVEPARPFLVVVLPGLVDQWKHEIGMITRKLKIFKYYGDFNDQFSSSTRGVLKNTDSIFTGDEANASVVVLTTYRTWSLRNGPSALREYRIKRLKLTSKRADSLFGVLDEKWPQSMKEKFSSVICDEAQAIKSTNYQAHTAVKWVYAWTALLTATPDFNCTKDIEAYIDIIQPTTEAISNDALRANFFSPVDYNPYNASQDDRTAKLLRCTTQYVKRFISNDQVDLRLDSAPLSKLFGDCMVRRTNVSEVDGKRIGDQIPPFVHHQITCKFTSDEQTGHSEAQLYELFAEDHNNSLVQVDSEGQATWNWTHWRLLLLLSTWTSFKHIDAVFSAEATPDLLARGPKLLSWIMDKLCTATGQASPDTLAGQLGMLYKGAPKIRAMMDLVADVVIMKQKKLIIMCTIPAQFVILYAAVAAIGVRSYCYHAGLSRKQKADAQLDFNTNPEATVFLSTYALAAVGLNLQKRCSWIAFFDPPPSISVGEQAISRCLRIGQTKTVHAVTFTLQGSFNDRQIRNNLRKAAPSVVMYLNKTIFAGSRLDHDESGGLELQLGDWVMYDGRLTRTDDERLPVPHNLEVIRGDAVIRKILEFKRGIVADWESTDKNAEDEEETVIFTSNTG